MASAVIDVEEKELVGMTKKRSDLDVNGVLGSRPDNSFAVSGFNWNSTIGGLQLTRLLLLSTSIGLKVEVA